MNDKNLTEFGKLCNITLTQAQFVAVLLQSFQKETK